MAHDHNGRVGPPRCEECNAPLSSDDPRVFNNRLLDLNAGPSLCLDCHFERNPFPKIKKRKGRPHIELRCSFELLANSFEVSPFDTAIPNSEVEPR
jgi:hypothetical protein